MPYGIAFWGATEEPQGILWNDTAIIADEVDCGNTKLRTAGLELSSSAAIPIRVSLWCLNFFQHGYLWFLFVLPF